MANNKKTVDDDHLIFMADGEGFVRIRSPHVRFKLRALHLFSPTIV